MAKLKPFALGELFAGSGGMTCADCGSKTWHVFLNESETQRLESTDRDGRHVVCEEKLGKILCLSCGQK